MAQKELTLFWNVVDAGNFSMGIEAAIRDHHVYPSNHDGTPLYRVRSGQMVGALPVGMETKEYNDAPY